MEGAAMSKMLGALAGLLAIVLSIAPVFAGDVSVKGHYRRDGTYVQPHMRSTPDSSFNNNWSTSPNINPYTGQQGTRQPRLYDSNDGLSGSGIYGSGGQKRSRSLFEKD
jgi:hypothetical protein